MLILNNMETKFVEKMLKRELIEQGQTLEKEMLVLQEKNKALIARNKGLYEDLEQERQAAAKLLDKHNKECKNKLQEITNLNTKIRGLEGKIVDLTQDYANDNESATKQIQILTNELKSANIAKSNRTAIIETLKAENAKLKKANNRGNYINLFLGGLAFCFFVYICWTM